MAGKSGKGRNRKGAHHATNNSEAVVSSDASKDVKNDALESKAEPVESVEESSDIKADIKESETAAPESQPKQGELHLYPLCVKTQSGEKLELQLNPGDSVMDIRQFLLDAPETCYFTCYDLLLHTKDGSSHQLEDYNEISEVADITLGGCSLEMVPALYDDRSIRAHVHRTKDMLSLSTLHASLSTSLALQYELAQKNAATTAGDTVKTEVPELDSLGFMEDVSGSLGSFLSSSSKEVRCIESIVFSSFNPPPSYRRLTGDLIYLDVITLEGNKFCITGTAKYFYVNSSTGNVLDPRPYKAAYEASTLVGLLQKISSKFRKAFREVLEQRASAHPFENVQSLASRSFYKAVVWLPLPFSKIISPERIFLFFFFNLFTKKTMGFSGVRLVVIFALMALCMAQAPAPTPAPAHDSPKPMPPTPATPAPSPVAFPPAPSRSPIRAPSPSPTSASPSPATEAPSPAPSAHAPAPETKAPTPSPATSAPTPAPSSRPIPSGSPAGAPVVPPIASPPSPSTEGPSPMPEAPAADSPAGAASHIGGATTLGIAIAGTLLAMVVA